MIHPGIETRYTDVGCQALRHYTILPCLLALFYETEMHPPPPSIVRENSSTTPDSDPNLYQSNWESGYNVVSQRDAPALESHIFSQSIKNLRKNVCTTAA